MANKTAIIYRDKTNSGPDGVYGLIKAFNELLVEVFSSVTMERPEAGVVTHPEIPATVTFPTPIPYHCEIALSPAFYAHGLDLGYGRGMIYHIRGIPGRDNCLFHPGNWPVMIIKAGDPQHYQLEGCIALGAAVAMLEVPAPDGRTLKGITSSVDACKAFYRAMEGKPFELTIV
jgi:hypothetical protein